MIDSSKFWKLVFVVLHVHFWSVLFSPTLIHSIPHFVSLVLPLHFLPFFFPSFISHSFSGLSLPSCVPLFFPPCFCTPLLFSTLLPSFPSFLLSFHSFLLPFLSFLSFLPSFLSVPLSFPAPFLSSCFPSLLFHFSLPHSLPVTLLSLFLLHSSHPHSFMYFF